MEKDLILTEYFSANRKKFDLDKLTTINAMYEDVIEYYAANSIFTAQDVRKAICDIPLSIMKSYMEDDSVEAVVDNDFVRIPVKHGSKISTYEKLNHNRRRTTRQVSSCDRSKIADDELLEGQFVIPEDVTGWVVVHLPGDSGVQPGWFKLDYKKLKENDTKKLLKTSYRRMIEDEHVVDVPYIKLSCCRGDFYLTRYKNNVDNEAV